MFALFGWLLRHLAADTNSTPHEPVIIIVD